MTIRTCVPADPQSKGGTEASVRIAKADLVPTEANLVEEYASFADLEAAYAMFCHQVNARPQRQVLVGRSLPRPMSGLTLRLIAFPNRPQPYD